ncbi:MULTISPECIES: TlpA family protein disulfide reductase [Pseudoalteromonas]|uniref:TlpA family protein disulfide reductase n=1 Tax=Pseudoalteromonas TaxID=53246 RepID=UPI00068FF827|nr:MULTISPECIES: TlpA disulfide reductase family protein [Pseudoalteromonas]ATG58730.1 TlpA family protein disulfide reductase [Pseudoalteromonas marina]MCK8119810.1 TlpA family protein disulfide reductase [Pseudoalteromonas sp. 2CM32C]
MALIRSTLMNLSLAILVFYLASAYQTRNLLETNHTPAPYFNLPILNKNNERFSIAELEGRTTIVYFFAPWCTICRYSMPNLQSTLINSDINVIGIALDYKNEQQVTQFIDDLNLSMPILLGNQYTQSNYKVSAFPTYYVINANLQITAHAMGYSTQLGIAARTW